MGKLTKKLSDGKPVKVYNVRPSTAVKRLRLTRLQPMTEETSESTTKRMKGLLKYSSSMFNVRKYLKWEHVTEYCENSSIHGFSYFTNRDIHRVERFWWILSVTLSLIGCCLLIKDQYDKWDQSPVIVTFSEKMISINTIPFPAVTICPEIKSKKEIFDFTKAVMDKVKLRDPPLYGLSEDELELLIVNLQICNQYATGDLLNFFDKKIANDTVFDLIKMMAPGMEESLFGCMFRTSHYSCDDLFQEIITDDGLCFTSNTLPHDEMFYNGTNFHLKSDNILGLEGRWTMEDGYGEEMDALETSLYPLRVLTAGSSVGLSLTLGVNEPDLDYLCRGQVQGFKVILHSPNELPDVKGQHFRVSVGEAVRMSIKPTVMVTTKSLEDYTPERRQCYFNAERKLNFMKAYTQRNCNLECIVNFTLAFCGCVPFFMPRNDSTPLCGELSVVCYLGVEDQLWETTGLEYTLIKTCNCLPACTSIGYDAEISQSKFEIHKYQKALRLSTIPDELKMSQLLIFFKENEFIPSKRSEMIGMTDFVAACGGLLGLFMGISLLSIVELVYYFSLRLFCRYRLENTKIVKKRMDVRVSKKRAPNFYW